MKNATERATGVAQTERIGLGDLVIAGVIALLTFGAAMLWAFPGLYPGVWNDAVVAAGVRPALSVAPGFWTALASWIYSLLGVSGGATAMRLLGHATLAGLAVCVYAVLREWLALAMRMRPQYSRRRTLVMRMASALGAAAFVTSDPVWTVGQCFSETTVLLALFLASLEFFFVFLRKGAIRYAYLCAVLLGLLTAETPMGVVLCVVFIALNGFILRVVPALESPFFKPAVMEVGKWHMTFLFIASCAAGVALNCWTYLGHGGVDAVGGTAGDIPLRYLLDYWHRLSTAGTLNAWILWTAVSVLPFAVATLSFPSSADEERFLPYSSGLIFFFCGLVVLTQSAFLPALWFWTYFPMNSQFIQTVGLFCCAATLALAMTILGVDSLCRNHRRLARQVFGENFEGEEEASASRAVEPVHVSAATVFLRRFGFCVIPLVVLAVMVPARIKTTTVEMREIVDEAVAEIVREAGDAKYLFSDGELDTAIELEAVRQGKPLRCYSLMGGPGAMSVYLRSRAMTDAEDQFSFRYDTAMGLRSWIRDKPERLTESAVLMGFDLWKRDGKALPPMGGLLSRPTGFASEEERLRGIETARALARRILAIYARKGGIKSCTNREIKRAFETVQWRLARMCLYRSEADDLAGRAESAIEDASLAKALNGCNAIYLDLVAALEKRNGQMLQKLTPREGLQLALVRADFTMGKLYAETILSVDPENPDANFAMGMYYQSEHQLSRAERYLLRCLIRRPREAAVYNNLAMLQIELKKFDAARVNIEKALQILPDSAAILDTKRALGKAVEAAKAATEKVTEKK